MKGNNLNSPKTNKMKTYFVFGDIKVRLQGHLGFF